MVTGRRDWRFGLLTSLFLKVFKVLTYISTRISNKVVGRIWWGPIHNRAETKTMQKVHPCFMTSSTWEVIASIRRIWKYVSSKRTLPKFILIAPFPFPQACCNIPSLNLSTSRSVMFKVSTSFQTWRRPLKVGEPQSKTSHLGQTMNLYSFSQILHVNQYLTWTLFAGNLNL